MKKVTAVLWMLFLGLSLFLLNAQTITQLDPEEIRQKIIENNTYENQIIWLDVRDDSEVEAGIIASQNCRPYHLSWNFDWNTKCSDLPKDIPIIIYCRSGHRALEAANALVDSGYDIEKLAIMAGGYNAYTGTKTTDSLLMEPWSALPAASYPLTQAVAMRKRSSSPRVASTPNTVQRRQQFNLKGQIIRSAILNPEAPVFILERIDDTNQKRVRGIQRLIQNDD